MSQVSLFDEEFEKGCEEIRKQGKVGNTSTINDVINVGDKVMIVYKGIQYEGQATRIYNNGDTINVSFKGLSTAFCKECVKKL